MVRVPSKRFVYRLSPLHSYKHNMYVYKVRVLGENVFTNFAVGTPTTENAVLYIIHYYVYYNKYIGRARSFKGGFLMGIIGVKHY